MRTVSTPAVTAACLGGACELCPGRSNTGKTCTCSCHEPAATHTKGDPTTATGETASLRLDTSGPAMFGSEPQQWAVARLDNGAEVRMRACGGYVEIRTWDETETCNPPRLDVTRIGSHVIDVRVPDVADDEVYVVTTEQGMSESLGADQIQVLVNLGLIEHERDDHVMVGAGGRGIGPVHHFYRAARP